MERGGVKETEDDVKCNSVLWHALSQRECVGRMVRCLSLWEEQQLQLPYHPHIPAAPPIVFADGAHLIAKTFVQNHSFRVNSKGLDSADFAVTR